MKEKSKYNMKKGDKKGSHVGTMLSFVIFLTFLVFLYSVIKPIIETGQDKKSILDSLETNILDKVSSDLFEVTITTDPLDWQDCIRLNGLLSEIEINSKIIVKNENGEILGFDISGDDLEINRNDFHNIFFKIYHAEEFEDLTGTYSCESRDYEIGFIKNETYAFETKINELIDEYGKFGSEDYEALKEELKVPYRNDFGFSFIDNEEIETIVGDKEITTNVYVEKIPIYYVDDNANVLLGFINIRVW